ncbi:MAG: hypothetical protein M1840_007134 [Geoglossum simile]|nr:MAG: hypothetical protein M1840_007134 [Geoglossum simile]
MSSSHVVIIDPRARRVAIKVTPARFLSDVLKEACTKLGLDAGQYTLKHNKKKLDLSCPIRLSGLPSGAKLELTQISHSPSVVTVALQVSDEVSDPPKTRFTSKFQSTTSLWRILRKFESEDPTMNLTGRGTPQANNASPGAAGRLYYETPVIQIMGRELSFRDMQMTLKDLGFNDGSTLLRLRFKTTQVPLEEAMLEISQYFKDVESNGNMSRSPSMDAAGSSSTANITGTQGHSEEIKVPAIQSEELFNDEPSATGLMREKITNPEEPDAPADESVASPKRLISVYAPTNNSTPQAAKCETSLVPGTERQLLKVFLPVDTFNAADYEPTIDQVRAHQSHLTSTAQNRRLLSDAELATKQRTAEERLAKVTDIEVKIRYPDQMQLVSKFTSTDTAASLHDFVRSTLKYMDESFSLSYASSKGPKTVPKDDKVKLIKDLGFEGRMLVTVTWDEDASKRARSAGNLRDEYVKMAREIKIQEIQAVQVAQEQERRGGKGKERAVGEEKMGGLRPKWFKFPGKK